jgi:hypothetical protein
VQRHSASTDCARPLCAIRATVRFWFDGDTRRVVLDRKISEWGGQGLLCESHADRLIVARGWELDDRRVSEPRLFSVDQADRAAAGRIRRLSQPEAHPSTPLPLDGGPLYALPSDYESPPAAPLTPMPTGTAMPITGPAAPSPAAAPESAANASGRPGDGSAADNHSNATSPNYPFDHPALDDSRNSDPFDRPHRANDTNDADRPVGASSVNDAPAEPQVEAPARPASARPKRRSHTDGNTPLLTRAFDAAASRVRPSSTMSSLIPQAPPLPEPPTSSSSGAAWPTVRFV